MLSLCFNHVATVASPFRSSVYSISWLNVLKSVRFSSHVKRKQSIKLVPQECKHIQPHKRQFDGTNRSCQFEL